MSRSRLLLFALLPVIFTAAMAVGASRVPSAEAHTAGFRWETPTPIRIVQISGGVGFWDGAIIGAVIDYNNAWPNDSLAWSYCSGCYNVSVIEMNFGNRQPTGSAFPQNGGLSCYGNLGIGYSGSCTKTGSGRADNGSIQMNNNTAISPRLNTVAKSFIIRHEMGHHADFIHVACIASNPSIMVTPDCNTRPTTLQNQDKSHLITHYP